MSVTKPAHLDDMLTLEECAAWLKLNARALAAKSKGRRASVPAIWLNSRVVRFHPRTIVAKFAAEAGVPFEVIAASLQHETNQR